MSEIRKISWKTVEVEKLSDSLSREAILEGTLAQMFIKRGGGAPRHSHVSEEYSSIISGAVKYLFDDREIVVKPGEVLVVPPNVPHWVVALEDAVAVVFFSPARKDCIRGEIRYIRKSEQAVAPAAGPCASA